MRRKRTWTGDLRAFFARPFIQGDFGKGLVTLTKGERQLALDFNKE